MRPLLVLLLCLGLCGCARGYYKMDVTPEQFRQDAYECKQQALAGSMDNIFIARNLQDECMKARGYTRGQK